MLSIIGIKKTIKQHTADMDITHIGPIPLYTISVHVNRMSIEIVANDKIEVNNVKPILHFLTVY
jgi:hypothetical protein